MQVAPEPPPAVPGSFFAALPGVVITLGPVVVPFVGNAFSEGACAGSVDCWVLSLASPPPPQPAVAATRRTAIGTRPLLIRWALTAVEIREVRISSV
jgi:hypothetical protein